MKQKIITTLKKNILIVELPENTQFDVLVNNSLWKDGIKFLTGTEEKFHFIKGSYTLLGKSDEIREEDARELVDISRRYGYKNYNKKDEMSNSYFISAVDSLLSVVESVIYWDVNPIKHPKDYSLAHQSLNWYTNQEKKFIESEQKTFDRNRSIILVKN